MSAKSTKTTTTKKSKSVKVVDTPVSVPDVAPVVADVAPVVADVTPVVADAQAALAADAEVEIDCGESMGNLITDLENVAKIVRGLANTMKKVKRAHEKEIKAAQKANKSTKKAKRVRDPNAPKRAPSGFNKPAPLSKDLCKFLGIEAKEELSRPAVTKQITKYIKDNQLQDMTNKRQINPDKKLSKLLSGPTDPKEPLTFFNLQKYIKHHFPKTSVKTATA